MTKPLLRLIDGVWWCESWVVRIEIGGRGILANEYYYGRGETAEDAFEQWATAIDSGQNPPADYVVPGGRRREINKMIDRLLDGEYDHCATKDEISKKVMRLMNEYWELQ